MTTEPAFEDGNRRVYHSTSGYVICDGGGWLPGLFADVEAAKAALYAADEDAVPEWQRLRDLMVTWEFTENLGRGYVRLGWPGSDPGRGSLVLCTDETAPEYRQHLDATLAELRRAANIGLAAQDVLDLFEPTKGCPDG